MVYCWFQSTCILMSIRIPSEVSILYKPWCPLNSLNCYTQPIVSQVVSKSDCYREFKYLLPDVHQLSNASHITVNGGDVSLFVCV